MSLKGDKLMWVMVLFDLPVKKKSERRQATQFRNFLLKEGFTMLQYSVYTRVCNGQDRVEKHLEHIRQNLPNRGCVRAIQITDRQFNRMKRFLGKKRPNEKKEAAKQLILF